MKLAIFNIVNIYVSNIFNVKRGKKLMANKLFSVDSDTKEALQSISSAMGAKQDIVKASWEYTIFSMLMKVAEKDDGPIRLTIPYIGNICIINKGNKIKDNKSIPDLEAWLSLSDNFKELYQKCRNGFYGDLSDYMDQNYIDRVIDNIN